MAILRPVGRHVIARALLTVQNATDERFSYTEDFRRGAVRPGPTGAYGDDELELSATTWKLNLRPRLGLSSFTQPVSTRLRLRLHLSPSPSLYQPASPSPSLLPTGVLSISVSSTSLRLRLSLHLCLHFRIFYQPESPSPSLLPASPSPSSSLPAGVFTYASVSTPRPPSRPDSSQSAASPPPQPRLPLCPSPVIHFCHLSAFTPSCIPPSLCSSTSSVYGTCNATKIARLQKVLSVAVF